MLIYLDDVRPAKYGWETVRSFEEFKKLIQSTNLDDIVAISFDHDLGEDKLGNTLPTGMDAMKWFIEHLIANNLELPSLREIIVHSSNPAGAENIRSYALSAQKANILPTKTRIR